MKNWNEKINHCVKKCYKEFLIREQAHFSIWKYSSGRAIYWPSLIDSMAMRTQSERKNPWEKTMQNCVTNSNFAKFVLEHECMDNGATQPTSHWLQSVTNFYHISHTCVWIIVALAIASCHCQQCCSTFSVFDFFFYFSLIMVNV